MRPPRLFAPPLRRLSVLVLVAAAVVGFLCWFFGLDVLPSVLVAAAVAAVGFTWVAVQEAPPLDWPQPEARRTPGARRDIETLGWSMRSRGGVADKSLARAREAARHRLWFLYGLDLFSPDDRSAVESVLAPSVVKILTAPRQGTLDLASFTRILSALEGLGSRSAPEPRRTPQTLAASPEAPAPTAPTASTERPS
ncbi:hypothetical protein AS850_13370 [Frondihabitans sp. 762G35]|uniref:hypothetical protein n=1 Tax=Frondihabitans sp. 762G35 TaxID=1446794 RepID=UPI000D22A2A7|nr:hypothetical protein [Frondihabitans sp. 762G35]ARC58067.1 hypothetical protein AS850_13370 [Frondihabitans sp. 762G35]